MGYRSSGALHVANFCKASALPINSRASFRRSIRISFSDSSRLLEQAVRWLYANDSFLKKPYADNLAALIHEPTFRDNLEHCLFPKILTIHQKNRLDPIVYYDNIHV